MTKKMPGLFAKNPPKVPITSLKTLVDDWIYRFGVNGLSKQMRDEVVDYCAAAKSRREAIQRACKSLRPNGKMHNHQSRVPEAVRERFANAIWMADVHKCKSFDDLYDTLEAVAPVGIGPVTLYDVATRIAAFLKLEVRSLYLHAGVLAGWRILHGNALHGTRMNRGVMRIARKDLPAEFQRITTDEVEDMLCAYREVLQPWLRAK